MNYKRSILLIIILILCSLFFSLKLTNNFGSNTGFVNDYGDRLIYSGRGSWYSLSKLPYSEVKSEYPQLATYFMAVPYLILDSVGSLDINAAEQIYSFVQEITLNPTNPNKLDALYLQNNLFMNYAMIFSLLMMVFLSLSIVLLYKMRPDRKYLAFLMLLPASLYYSYNRFDIMLCFLSLFSLYMLYKEQYKFSAFAIAVGLFLKWYLVLLLPVFITYYSKYKKVNWSMIIVFSIVSIIIIVSAIYWSGIESLLVPYQFHLDRGMDQPSITMVIHHFFSVIVNTYNIMDHHLYDHLFYKYVLRAAFLLQFSIIPLCLTSRIDSFEKVVKWSALSILVFILFAKINSPQWILWVSPLLILIAKDWKYVSGIVLLDLFTYLQYPITYMLFSESYISYNFGLLIHALQFILLLLFAGHLFVQLITDNYIFIMLKDRLVSKQMVLR